MMMLWVFGLGSKLGLPHALLGMALFGLCMITPHFGRANDDALWVFNQMSFYGLMIGGMAAGIFLLGVGGILWALAQLFGASSATVWVDCSILVTAVFWPLYAISFVPRLPLPAQQTPGYPGPLSFVLIYVAQPLLLIYGLIIAVYGVQVLFLGHTPVASVSWMVMAFATAGVVLHMLLYPLRGLSNGLVSFFYRYFYYLLVPLLGLLFWAVFVRIQAYGVTENRYLAVLGGVWAALLCLIWLLRDRFPLWMAPASLALALLLASFGPWGAEATSFRSQQARLQAVLGDVGLLDAAGLREKANAEETWAQRRDLSSLLDFFHERRDGAVPDILLPVRRTSTDLDSTGVSGWPAALMRQWGLVYVPAHTRKAADALAEGQAVQETRSLWYQAREGGQGRAPLRVTGYDYVLPVSKYRDDLMTDWPSAVPLGLTYQGTIITVTKSGETLGQVDLRSRLQEWIDRLEVNAYGPVLEFELALTSGKARLYLEGIELRQLGDQDWLIGNANGWLLYKLP